MNGHWLIETTRVKITQAQKKVDMHLATYIAFNNKCTSSRINPSLVDKNIVQLTQNLSEVYDNIHQENQEQYHNHQVHNQEWCHTICTNRIQSQLIVK